MAKKVWSSLTITNNWCACMYENGIKLLHNVMINWYSNYSIHSKLIKAAIESRQIFIHILITSSMALVQCNQINSPHTATEMSFWNYSTIQPTSLSAFCRTACQMMSAYHAHHLGNCWNTKPEWLTCCAQTALPFWKLLNILSLWLAGWLDYPL